MSRVVERGVNDGQPQPGSLEYWARRIPAEVALYQRDARLTWQQWDLQANRLAEALAAVGILPGDRVAVAMQNRLEWFVTQAAVAKLQALLVPIAWRLAPEEMHYIVADSGARAFVFDHAPALDLARVWTNEPALEPGAGRTLRSAVALAVAVCAAPVPGVRGFAELVSAELSAPVRIAARAPRSIVYTSGTTGRPRGVVAERTGAETTAGMSAAVAAVTPALVEVERRPLRNLLGAPLNHAAGQASARGTLYYGGCVYVMPRFDAAEALELIERERITTTFLVPTMLNRIMNLPPALREHRDMSSLQALHTGASPCPQRLKVWAIQFFGAHCLYEGYGTTEVGVVARMAPADHLRRPGSCGQLMPGVQLRIVDDRGQPVPAGEVGEVFVRSPFMITRYLNESPPKELVEGYFGTGDMGRIDADGYLYILDRKKDMIISGGVNIYPAEIERVLRSHPAVLDAAVFGAPHPHWGEEVRAVVECVPGQTVSPAELLSFAEGSLAGYKRPRAVEVLAEIPRNTAGKILKAKLRAPFWVGADTKI